MTRRLGRDRADPACQGKLLSFQSRGAGGEELTAALFFLLLLLFFSLFSQLEPNANSPEDLFLSILREKVRGERKKGR